MSDLNEDPFAKGKLPLSSKEAVAACPLSDSDDKEQGESGQRISGEEESDEEEHEGEESDQVDNEDKSIVHSPVNFDDDNAQEFSGGHENSGEKQREEAAADFSSKPDAEKEKPEGIDYEDISALQSPVESDDTDQDHSEDTDDQDTLQDDCHSSFEEDMDKTSKKVRTLTEMAEKRVLDQLKEAVTGYQATANYCCGGSIPISATASQPNAERPGTSKIPITSPPTVLRWDIPDNDGLSKKVQFPLLEVSDSNSSLEDLLAACAPATFGLGGEDVLDETYRKAGKLDRSQFSIDFHPHDYGIVDAISQILLPDFKSPGMKGRGEHRGVLAELYKFNVCSWQNND